MLCNRTITNKVSLITEIPAVKHFYLDGHHCIYLMSFRIWEALMSFKIC